MNDETKKASGQADHRLARRKFLELSLESTRKSYYPQLKKQLENAENNQKRLQLLIDNLPAQISYVNRREHYVFVNREFEKAFGLTRDQIIGRGMEEILGHRIYSEVRPHIERVLSGQSGHFELPFSSRQNDPKWYEINYVAETDREGKISGFYILTIDLTNKKHEEAERLKLKDRLRQAQKMEAIGTLSGGIAHDFNNILSGIFGYSQLVESHINNPESVREYNRKIFEGAQRASSLIKQILSFSRQTQYAKEPVYLKNIINEALNLLRSTIPSNIEIRADLNSKAAVLADATQIHQVIMNLCTNAYHAMGDDSGMLTVNLKDIQLPRDKWEKVSVLSTDHFVKLMVSDTGPGIDEKIKEKIFDPYFTTKKIDRGTGLGLAVVAGIVKKHNGFIEFETKRNVGTSFSVYFPVIRKDTPTLDGSAPEEKRPQAGTEKIMLVDDEKAILDTLTAILSRKGYQVSGFSNGEEALEAFCDAPDQFNLVITDMTMPKMTGDKLAKEILKIRKEVPVIICTGYHENFTETDAMNAGIKRYVHKPVIGSELAGIIRELLEPQD